MGLSPITLRHAKSLLSFWQHAKIANLHRGFCSVEKFYGVKEGESEGDAEGETEGVMS